MALVLALKVRTLILALKVLALVLTTAWTLFGITLKLKGRQLK